MPLVKLELENLGVLDDKIVAAFNRAVREAVLDCGDRPHDKAARTVSLELVLTPQLETDGDCGGANGEFKIKAKIPARVSKTYGFNTNRSGHLIFSTTNPENADQLHLDDIVDDEGTTKR